VCTRASGVSSYHVKDSDGGHARGLAQVQAFFGTVDSTMTVQSFDPREFIAQGDQVVVLGDYA
jgi:hypothetical protein